MSVYVRKLSRAFHVAVHETLGSRERRKRVARGEKVDDRFDVMLDRLDVAVIELRVWTVGVHVILFCAIMAMDFFGH